MATVFHFGDSSSPIDNQFMYMDTSFAYEIIGKSKHLARQNECIQFAKVVVSRGGLLVLSTKAREELRLMIPAREFEPDKAARKVKIAQSPTLIVDAAARVQAAEKVFSDSKKGYSYIEDLGYEPCGNELLRLADHAMVNYSIEYGDAAHYVIARNCGLWEQGSPVHVAVLDADWLRIDDPLLVLHVDTNTYNQHVTTASPIANRLPTASACPGAASPKLT